MTPIKSDWWDEIQTNIEAMKQDVTSPKPGQIWRLPVDYSFDEYEDQLVRFDYVLFYIIRTEGNSVLAAIVHTQEHLALMGDIRVSHEVSPLMSNLIISCDLVQRIKIASFDKGDCFGEIKEGQVKDSVLKATEEARSALQSHSYSQDQKVFDDSGNPLIYLGFTPRKPRFWSEIKIFRSSLAGALESFHPLLQSIKEQPTKDLSKKIIDSVRKFIDLILSPPEPQPVPSLAYRGVPVAGLLLVDSPLMSYLFSKIASSISNDNYEDINTSLKSITLDEISLIESYSILASILLGKQKGTFLAKPFDAFKLDEKEGKAYLSQAKRNIDKQIEKAGLLGKRDLLLAFLLFKIEQWQDCYNAFIDVSNHKESLLLARKARLWLILHKSIDANKADELSKKIAEVEPQDIDVIKKSVFEKSLEEYTNLQDIDSQIIVLLRSIESSLNQESNKNE